MSEQVKNILVIDDEPSQREYLSEALTKEGYHVTEAENGEEALVKLKDNDFALVYLDIQMPVLDGIGTLRQFSHIEKLPPVIVMSAHKIPDEAFELGTKICVYKPLQLKDLIPITKETIEKTQTGKALTEALSCIKCHGLIKQGQGKYIMPDGIRCSTCGPI
jgi:two-component system, OmpR family, response regulator ResD